MSDGRAIMMMLADL